MTDFTSQEAAFRTVQALISERYAMIERLCLLVGGEKSIEPCKSSTAYFKVYKTRGSGQVRNFEARLPVSGISPRFLIIEFVGDLTVDPVKLTRRLESEPVFSPPNPRQPLGSPGYLVFEEEWGALKFGIGRGDRLLNVILDVER